MPTLQFQAPRASRFQAYLAQLRNRRYISTNRLEWAAVHYGRNQLPEYTPEFHRLKTIAARSQPSAGYVQPAGDLSRWHFHATLSTLANGRSYS